MQLRQHCIAESVFFFFIAFFSFSDFFRSCGEQFYEATTACLCFMGGQLTLEEGCSLRDCEVGVSVCDQAGLHATLEIMILGLYRENGKENGNCYHGLGLGL